MARSGSPGIRPEGGHHLERPASRAVWALTGASLAFALVATLFFVAATLHVRVPYWGEAEVLFDASRIRKGLPLFVDPLVGAHDMGEPPSRWYVTYPPLWSSVLALVPAPAALVVGRVASTMAWLGSLAWIGATARRECRANALACAAFVAGSWILVNFAMVARPDAIACAIAAAGLVRAVRKGRIDAVSAVLLVLAPWVKPTLLGLPAGAFAADLARRRRAALPALGVALGVFAIVATTLHLASGGAYFAHVVRSNAQPMTLEAWLDHVPSRIPFFAPPIVLAALHGWRDRTTAGSAIGLGALAASVAWVLVALAKTGSASNYWMEPCVAAVVLVAHAAPGPFRFGGTEGGTRALAQASIALVAALYADVATVRSSIEHAKDYRDDAAFVATLPETCGGADGIAADEAGIELAVDGRILTPTYQMVYLVRSGAYPAATWIADLSSPSVRCVVEHTGQLRLEPEIARFLDEHFVRELEHGSFRVLLPKH